MQVGKIAHKYLSDYAAKQNVDKTFGIQKNPLDKLYEYDPQARTNLNSAGR